MPLILKEENKKIGNLAVWNISEDESFFLKKLSLQETQLNTISNWVKKRRIEWLAGRYIILNEIGSIPSDIIIDAFGKPHLPDTKFHISISHSKNLLGVAWSLKRIGLDIQMYNPKMSRVSHKFCTREDHVTIGQAYSISQQEHMIWSAKEAVYKAYGRKKLDFKENIFIKACHSSVNGMFLDMCILKESINHLYLVKMYVHSHMVMAVAVQS